ncbi:aldehyde dehydrogenase family protein [Alkalicoccus daliensis]|uniref:Propionaldehyde dehydrogenase n=1 Tax=Alkalicoccus daliensis TaxID=745820 RepID=A0A1H0HBX2_9BACI|nr:aldehyde dehydrogenase family protein [Alkalicoccus daliensis]SDO16689.1 propionaldehyde dehydrogenase [Alkalicoccus daliensis]
MSISEEMLKQIVTSVMKNVEEELGHSTSTPHPGVNVETFQEKKSVLPPYTHQSDLISQGHSGIFTKVNDAVDAAKAAQKELMTYSIKQRKSILETIKKVVEENKESYSTMAVEETGLGSVSDKVAKHELVISKTPGVEDLRTEAVSGDFGLTIEEDAPFGVIGAVTPVTNPTTTVIHNSLAMLAAGNTVVFNVHPSSKATCAKVVADVNQGIKGAGGPGNLITMIGEPTLETVNQLASHPDVQLLVGTGGKELVKSLLKSGKKAIGAGAGNPPVIVDETADIEAAAKAIIQGAAFDNNILCIGEKEVFVLAEVFDELVYQLLQYGGYMLNEAELKQVMATVLINQTPGPEASKGCTVSETKKRYHVAKKWIGKSAVGILKEATGKNDSPRLLLCDVNEAHPFVQLEQMMPVLPLVKVSTFEEAVDQAVIAEKGNRHTAIIHSKNVDRLTHFAQRIQTTIFVKNASSLAGVGFGGEGYTSMTIAGPTGEGITSPRTFTRTRRCVLAEGGFRIIG